MKKTIFLQKECLCLDPDYEGPTAGPTGPTEPTEPEAPTGPTSVPPPEDGCGSPQWFGDGYCDDDNNNEDCEWDGGDCCGDDVLDSFCEVSRSFLCF